ncbi:MAG: hypothetical protein J2P45_11405 [Candidatus Dormibacteraeota bacterium]|nr:hypothetical protein [Candidatus Dormibacteraeota bacterium]
MLTSFDVVLIALALLSGLALVFCLGNAARAGIETQAYANATPDLRQMRVSEATVTGGPAIQDWTAGPTGQRRGLRLCRLDLVGQGTDHLASRPGRLQLGRPWPDRAGPNLECERN